MRNREQEVATKFESPLTKEPWRRKPTELENDCKRVKVNGWLLQIPLSYPYTL